MHATELRRDRKSPSARIGCLYKLSQIRVLDRWILVWELESSQANIEITPAVAALGNVYQLVKGIDQHYPTHRRRQRRTQHPMIPTHPHACDRSHRESAEPIREDPFGIEPETIRVNNLAITETDGINWESIGRV